MLSARDDIGVVAPSAKGDAPGDATRVVLRLPPPLPGAKEALVLEDATFGTQWAWAFFRAFPCGVPLLPWSCRCNMGGGLSLKRQVCAPQLDNTPPCARTGWGAPNAGPAQLSNVTFTLERGMRVAVLGPNGAGKSTLLKALSGTLPLWGGKRRVGDDVHVGVFTQDLAQELPQEQQARAHCGRCGPCSSCCPVTTR